MVYPAPPTIEAEAARILATLPEWFGIPESTAAYVRAAATGPTLVTTSVGQVTGFVTLEQHFAESVELHCLAVQADRRGQGLGRELVEAALAWARERGGRFLQVKTLAATHPDPHYAQTRGFYHAMGFVPLEVFPDLWGPGNPCLVLIRTVDF